MIENIKILQKELTEKLAKSPKGLDPFMKDSLNQIKALLDTKDVDLGTLRELRTNLRLLIDPSGKGPDLSKPSTRYMQKVYSAITEDMYAMVKNTGDEAAVKSLKKADAYTLNRQKFDMKPIIDKILKFDTDKKAFDF